MRLSSCRAADSLLQRSGGQRLPSDSGHNLCSSWRLLEPSCACWDVELGQEVPGGCSPLPSAIRFCHTDDPSRPRASSTWTVSDLDVGPGGSPRRSASLAPNRMWAAGLGRTRSWDADQVGNLGFPNCQRSARPLPAPGPGHRCAAGPRAHRRSVGVGWFSSAHGKDERCWPSTGMTPWPSPLCSLEPGAAL